MGLGKGDVLLLLPLSLFTTPPMTSSQLLCLCQHGGCRDSLSLLHSKDIVTNKCEHYFEALFAFLGGSMLWTKSNGLACFQDLDIPLFANQGWWCLKVSGGSLLMTITFIITAINVRPIIRLDGSIYRGGGMLGGDAVRLERKVIPVIAPPTGSGHCTFTSWPGKSAIYFPIYAYSTLHTTFIVMKGIRPTNQVQCANRMNKRIG